MPGLLHTPVFEPAAPAAKMSDYSAPVILAGVFLLSERGAAWRLTLLNKVYRSFALHRRRPAPSLNDLEDE